MKCQQCSSELRFMFEKVYSDQLVEQIQHCDFCDIEIGEMSCPFDGHLLGIEMEEYIQNIFNLLEDNPFLLEKVKNRFSLKKGA